MWFGSDGLGWAQHATIPSLDIDPVSVGLVAFDGSELPSSSVAHYDCFTILSGVVSGFPDSEAARPCPVPSVRKNSVSSGEVVYFDFSTSCSGRVVLRVYDIAGALVATVLNEELAPGRHTAIWRRETMGSGRATPAGLYFIALSGSGTRSRSRLVLLH
jgi:hypothetical protein